MKNYLILSGGGFRGSFQLGAVEVLLGRGIKFDKIFGVSAGAINGAMIAQGKIDELKGFYQELYETKQSYVFGDVIGRFSEDKIKVNIKRTLSLLIKGLFRSSIKESIDSVESLFNTAPLKSKLEKVIKKDDFISDLYFGTISYLDGEYTMFNHSGFNSESDLVDGILASASIPVILGQIESFVYKGLKYYSLMDGGVRKSSPISDAIEVYKLSGDSDVHFYIINCHTGSLRVADNNTSIVPVAARTIDIMMSELFKKDLKMFMTFNELSECSEYNKFNYTLIQPDDNSLGGYLDTSHIISNYIKGRNKALKK